ncbi:MAG: 2-isopropylmalate synthase [Micavibrio aeruginosavorus]|uniref:2-isopropylmalate synthase n=1 Tax=Micavibrio aeruginosavorus TaxID=349221 RepID=A0A2W5MQU6_9BACT|nr:MAG: 2-isopropylmalate synthase [Micavibrio aeruginosavorus]
MNDRIIIFDTTLRDGEQSPGCSMNLEEKLRMARLLDDMGVDVIEAGFPIASPGDFEAVTEIAKVIKRATVCGLSRAIERDIDVAGEALKPAKNPRIHTFISTSPQHMRYQLQMDEEQVLESVVASVTRARKYTDNVEWSAMDATRSDWDFLCRAIDAAIRSGATTINIPDTVGYAVPEEYADLIRYIRNKVVDIDKCVISTHCHNDLGLAVANSLAGVSAGARQIECTINGIGERAGNAALEEVVMALKTRSDKMPFDCSVDSTMIMKASRTLANTIGFSVQPNKAIVGANAFAHESGIHQDGVLKNASTYEIMTPESVGLTRSELVLGKHSGRHALKSRVAELGYEMGDNALNDLFKRFKDLADKKKQVFDDDIIALIEDTVGTQDDAIRFVALQVQAGSKGPQVAELELTVNGETKTAKVEGNGPIDAIFKAIRAIIPHDDAQLQLYQVHAVTGGTDAQAEVTVRLEESGKTVNGQGADADTLVASARAYVHALNKLLTKRTKTKPSEAA